MPIFRKRLWPALALALAASPAAAQTLNANSASFNAGYGRTAGQENQAVDVGLTDASGNLTVVNGLFGASSGVFAGSSARLSGAASAASGAGASASGAGYAASGASAIGNDLNVVVQGSNNTVIVQSQQTNTGDITANASTNGKP